MNVNENTVILGLHNHTVIVTDRNIVHIHHHKTCTKPCESVDKILTCLEDELWVDEGYSVMGY
jgi:hypothetical protein